MRLKNFFQSKFRVSRIISRICSKAKPYNHDLALALRSKHGVARYCVLFPVSTLFVSIPGYGQMSKILFPLWSLVSLDAVRVNGSWIDPSTPGGGIHAPLTLSLLYRHSFAGYCVTDSIITVVVGALRYGQRSEILFLMNWSVPLDAVRGNGPY